MDGHPAGCIPMDGSKGESGCTAQKNQLSVTKNRRHFATVKVHNGTLDGNGQPTYDITGDWISVVTDWPVEMKAVRGGEKLRGRQVAANTTHVIFGDFNGGNGILPEMHAVITNTVTGKIETHEIVAAMDPDGDGREMRVELKREI